MRMVVFGMATIVATSVTANIAFADQPGQPRQGGLRVFFQRLDANNDGLVSRDEVPDGAPDHVKAMLKRADKNGDNKVSPEEMLQAASQFRSGHPSMGPRGAGPPADQARERSEACPSTAARGSRGPSRSTAQSPRPPATRRPHPSSARAGQGSSRPASRTASDRSAPRQGPPRRGPNHGSYQGYDPGVIFARLDKDKDGKLSQEEFSEGMRRVHAALRDRRGMPGMGPVGHHGPMAGPMGQAGPGRHPAGRPGIGYMATMHAPIGHPMTYGPYGPGQIRRPMGHPQPRRPAIGAPGMGRPPLGRPPAPRQFAGKPGAEAGRNAEERMNASRDRQAAAVKMRAEFAKRAEAIKKRAADAGKAVDREKAAKARRAAEKTRVQAAQKPQKAQKKK